jgi:glycosyltransferase involved in cell wall biosynthesis
MFPSTPNVPTKVIVATLLAECGETGVQSHFNAFRRYLEQNGGDIDVVTPFRAPALLVYPIFGVRKFIDLVSGALSVWWYRHWHYVFLKLALRRVLTDGPPAVVYAQCPLSAKAALTARRGVYPPIVLAVHFNDSQADEWAQKGKLKIDGRMYRAIQRLEAGVLPQVDGIVYVSRFMKARLQERIPALTAVRSAVVPNFHERKSGPLTSVDVSGDLITIGTLEARKNHRYLLHVLAHAAREGKSYTLSIVGHGPLRAELERLTRELNISKLVRFIGFQPDAARFLGGHRVYVHSAIIESFGIVLIEAMSAGLPILAAPVGGIPEVFRDGLEGFYWPLDDASAGARRLISLMEDRDLYRRMADAATRRFNDHYEMTSVAGELRDFLLAVTPEPDSTTR